MNPVGVRYITEEFIKLLTHEDHLDRIKKLNLDCGKEDKKIRYIEHLDNLTNINVLSIRFHAIEKIEKLDKLTNLRELHLSVNKITRLDGLENLLNIKILDVRENQISSIPYWFTRRCKYLTKINFSRNLFDSIEEISKLSTLKDLLDLDVSENPVAAIAHYRLYVIMRLKYLQVLDNRDVLADEKKCAIEQFEENELDRVSSRLIETEKQLEQMKESQTKLQKECFKQEQYQKDLNKKQKSNIEHIKQLEENLKSKDILLKKKSEDLFRACQKYYELEQDLAFIKIDAKFDLLSNNIGPLEEPDNVSDHSQISSTGDQAYMGKGQFITKKEADMLMERKRMKQNHLKNENNTNGRNSTQKLKEDFVDSLNEKVKEKMIELNKINKEISEKNKVVDKLNNNIDHKEIIYDSNTPTKFLIPSLNRADRPRSALASINRLSPFKTLLSRPRRLSETESTSKPNDHSSLTDLFLEKVENLTEMQKEAEELRRQMESTEKESNRQQKDIEFLRSQLEKLKVADPSLANHIENEMKEKELHVDENLKLYDHLSKRLDQLSLAIEKSMNDIREIEAKLLEDNQYFTNDMKEKINTALSQLTQTVPNRIHHDYKKVLDNCKEVELENQRLHQRIFDQIKEIETLQNKLQNDGVLSSRRSARSIDDEVEVLRKELNQLRQDAMAAKDDLESEIEIEKVLNDELQKQVEELKENEEHLTENLEILHDKHEKLIDQMKEDHYLMQQNIEREMMNFQDNVLHRIKIASTENQIENLEKSKNPIDKALLNLIKSVEIEEKPNDVSVDPEISKITGDLDHIKVQLSDINRKISFPSSITPLESLIDQKIFSLPKKIDSQTLPVKKMLTKSSQIYNEELKDMKLKISTLQDSLNKALKMRKIQIKSRPFTDIKLLPKMSKETLVDFSSSEDIQSTPKVRAHSQDRIPKKFKSVNSTAKKWSSVQQNISSDEQRIFDAIQDELQELIKHLNLAEYRNNQRIEEAMNRLSDFERELQGSHDDRFSKERYENIDQEKENIEEYLKETMDRVERCQEDIRQLNTRFGKDIRNTKIESGNNNYALEMEKMSGILQSQKAEIERLNNILENLIKSAHSNNPQFVQTLPVNNSHLPGTPYISNGFLPQTHNSHSTPVLNSVPYSSVVTSPMKNAGSLFCNVPEHHYLEDYFQNNGKHKSSWKMKQKFKSDSEKYMMTLDSLKDDINKKNEELDNVEIQISKQTNEIGRLNYQIDQLNYTKQDLLNNISSLRQETELVTRETIASTSESLGHLRARKSQLTDEINKMDLLIRDKKDELFRSDNELKNSRMYLAQIQEQTSETLRKHDEARMNHRKLILECEELEKKSKEASLELARAMNELNTVQIEISNLTSNKMNLEDVLAKIQSIINNKDHDFQKINEEINRATQQLNSLKSNLNMTAEQNREKIQMLSEGDQLLSDTRLELNRLKNEIVLNQEHLQKMESEIGERNAAIDVANSELERSRQLHHRLIQEYQNEQSRIKRELSDLKFDLENLKDEKNDLMCTIENSKMKSIQVKENIDKQEQTQMIQQSELEKLNCQTQHIDSMLKMKQGQLDKILGEYQTRLIDLEKIDEEIHKQHIESKKLDTDIKRKASEIDKIRQIIATDTESLQRLQFDKDSIEITISTLTKEKGLFQNEKKDLESNVKILRKQESQVQDSLTTFEAKVSQFRTELEKMHSDKCSETIKRDELKTQVNSLSKQLHESKCELQSIKERLIMIESQCDERTGEIRKKMQLQSNLNIEIRKLQDQIRLANISLEEINSETQKRKEKLNRCDNEITKKNDEIKLLEKKIYDLQNNVSKEDNKLEKILKNSSFELSQLKSEITEKLENLEATGNRLHQLKKDVAIKEFTEQKIFELEEIIKQQENKVHHYEQENRKLSNHLSVINRDLAVLRQNNQFEMENKDKEIARLRKRVAKEIFQLEKLAEEQCNRANSLSDDLNQARRDYMLLRNRCLSQEHFIEQQNLFKEYMQPNNAKISSNWENNFKPVVNDLPIGVETAILAEHQRHLQNQLNLLKDNIVSATQASQTAQYNFDNFSTNKAFDNNLKWNTGSSGLGSTLDHTGNSLDTLENERLRKSLHNQFNDDIEKINNENNKYELRCHQLRTEVDNLKSNLPSDKSPLSHSE